MLRSYWTLLISGRLRGSTCTVTHTTSSIRDAFQQDFYIDETMDEPIRFLEELFCFRALTDESSVHATAPESQRTRGQPCLTDCKGTRDDPGSGAVTGNLHGGILKRC
ncbi:hypothetical protein MHYP_G00129150 [Metynnis hypsauchen]